MKNARSSGFDQFFMLLVKAPSWIPFVLSVVSYLAIKWISWAFIAPLNQPLAIVLNETWAPIALIFFFCLGVIDAFHRTRRAKIVEGQAGLESLRNMQSKDFEFLIAEIYSRHGYAVDYSFDPGPDGGVDVVLKKDGRTTLVQCKCWKNWTVGVSVVREMYGVLLHEEAAEMIIVTTGKFTEDAMTFVKGKPMRLVDGQTLWPMVQGVQSGKVKKVEPEVAIETPACPKCGGEMTLRIAKSGPTAGQSFWSCLEFPKCRGNRSIA